MKYNHIIKFLLIFVFVFKYDSLYAFTLNLIVDLPKKNINFVGRIDYIRNIKNNLKKENIIKLSGYGGIGKTQIVKEYVYHNIKQYDVIWWVNAKNNISMQSLELANLWNASQNKNKEGKISIFSNQVDSFQSICNKIRYSKLKWLIILDDLQDFTLKEIKELFSLTKNKKNIKILITTRKQEKDIYTENISPFSSSEGLLFFRKMPSEKYQGKKNQLLELISILNNYPISIACAYSYIVSNLGVSVEEYIKLYKKRNSELSKVEGNIALVNSDIVLDNYYNNIKTIMSLTLSKIKNSSEDAYKLLHLIAIMGNKNIPRAVIEEYFLNDKLRASSAISELMKYSILQDKEDNGMILQYHDAIREVLLKELDKSLLKNFHTELIKIYNDILPRKITLLTPFLSKHNDYLIQIQEITKVANKYKQYNGGYIKLKIRELEFVLTNQRNQKKVKQIIEEIDALLKDDVQISRTRYLLMKSTYTAWFLSNYDLSMKQAKKAMQFLEQVDSSKNNSE